MCLGIPMQIEAIDGFVAHCKARGIKRSANLIMLQHETLAIDDYIVVHLGNAIQKITAEEARAAWLLYDQMLAAEA